MFAAARLQLTAWYLVIILLISSVFSFVFYLRTVVVIEREFVRIEKRLQDEARSAGRSSQFIERLRFLPADMERAKERILYQILFINAGILFLVGGMGYMLSGKTLQPIHQALEEQKRFISDAAHELRTPITALKTSLEVELFDKKLSKKMRQLLTDNLRDVTALESLTQALLQLAQLQERGVEREHVSLHEVLESTCVQLRPLTDAKNLTIQQDFEAPKDCVWANAALIRQIVTIFIDNAIKYSPEESTITLATKILRYRWIRIEIADQGQGIPAKHLPHVFDRFYRVDGARTGGSAKSGHGLGLSIAKRLINQVGGTVGVTSAVGVGTTFHIHLPLAGKSA